MIAGLAALVTWLGADLIVLADGRRGLALGLALSTAGLSTLALDAGGGVAVVALAAGGAAGSLQGLRAGPAQWNVMPPGSTPRLVLCVVAGLISFWFAATVTSGSDAPLRFAVLAVVSMMCIRIVTARHAPAVLTSVACLALSVAAATSFGEAHPEAAVYVAAGLIAAGVTFVRAPQPQAA